MRKILAKLSLVTIFLSSPLFGITGSAYITASNEPTNTITVIDTATNTVTATISIPFGEGGPGAFGMAISSDGLTGYVCLRTAEELAIIDLTNNTVTNQLPLTPTPGPLVITPDNKFLYAIGDADNPGGVVSVFDITAQAQTLNIFCETPTRLAVTPNGTLTLVTGTMGKLFFIETATNTVTTTLLFDQGQANGISISPDGSTAYVATGAFITLVDIPSRTIRGTIPLPAAGSGTGLTPDGSKLYVTDFFNASVYVISTAANAVIATIGVGSMPIYIAVDPTGVVAYTANFGDNTASVIDVATDTLNAITPSIPVGGAPPWVAFSPLPLPAMDFGATSIKDIYLDHTNRINRISWIPSTDPLISGYRLFRNGQLIATIPISGPFVYDDGRRNRHEVDTYTIYTFNYLGTTSLIEQVTVTVP